MKAEELMIGDYITFRDVQNDSNCPKLRVCGLIGDDVYVSNDGDPILDVVAPDDIVGIPLTAQILEKNFREYLPGINLMYQLKGPYFAMNEEGNQWVFGLVKEDGEKSRRYPLVKITYVHELQHALRICRITKEINMN